MIKYLWNQNIVLCLSQQKQKDMRTLALNRKYKGIYEVQNEDILISISNPYAANGGMGTNSWETIIECKKTGEELIHEWFDTKKQASEFGADWVMRNY